VKPAHRLDPERLLILSEEAQTRQEANPGVRRQIHAALDREADKHGLEAGCDGARTWLAKNTPGSARAKRQASTPKERAEQHFRKIQDGEGAR